MSPPPTSPPPPFRERNLLDRWTSPAALRSQDEHEKRRERAILERSLGLDGGTVVSIGCGWHPGRHLFPRPGWRLVAADQDPNRPKVAVERGEADEGVAGRAGELDELPDGAFDVVLHRLLLHHVVYAEPLAPVFAEAHRLLRPGGALVAIEPNLWHPLGLALAAANAAGAGLAVHGTDDDVPLSPRRLVREARAAGLDPELHGVSFGWRRLPPRVQRLVARLDEAAADSAAGRRLAHTVLLIARRPR